MAASRRFWLIRPSLEIYVKNDVNKNRRMFSKEDPCVFLELPTEERKILQQALGIKLI
jgi:hypothetical protein